VKKTVLLRLNDLQSWGVRSRFELRDAGTEPSKSGVLGLVASALGMPRDDDARLKRLASCWFGVRADREGRSQVDFHTVGGGEKSNRVHGAAEAVLTQREYLADASFLVALGYDDHALAEEIHAALEDPRWLLYQGRKCCVTSPHLRAGLLNADPETVLRTAPWPWPDRPERPVRLILEAPWGQGQPRQDHPLSFRPGGRLYRRRWVTTLWIQPRDILVAGDAPPATNTSATSAPTPWAAARQRARREAVRVASDQVHVTRALLNPQSPEVALDLADCHAMHRRVMSGFPMEPTSDRARLRHGVLHRVDCDLRAGQLVLHVQSTRLPDWTKLPEGYLMDLRYLCGILGQPVPNPATTTASWAALRVGERYAYKLRGNPASSEGRAGRPHAWIEEQAQRAGVELLETRVTEEATLHGERPPPEGKGEPGKITLASASFEGVLQVADPDALRIALVQGLGRGKAFGFGLLLLSPLG
jgi:CRISPR system Cascade subunit CasD